jgi:Ni,Fe-hydrogenase III large subunit
LRFSASAFSPLPRSSRTIKATVWREEPMVLVCAPGNRLARCKVKDPSLQNWPALSEAILGNIIPDFPVVNKSFNLSYSGTDR